VTVPRAAGGKGSVPRSAACTNGMPSRISEKVGKVSSVGQEGDGAGRGGLGMFWGKGASSKVNESKIGKRSGANGCYKHIFS